MEQYTEKGYKLPSSLTQTTVVPPRAESHSQSEIADAFNRLDNLVAAIEDHARSLVDELSPVLHPSETDVASPLRASEHAVPLADIAHTLGDRLADVGARLGSIRGRLAL